MTLGEWVHCDGYIKKSGNHYNVIPWKEKRQAATGGYPITNFEPHIDAAIFEDSDKICSKLKTSITANALNL